MERCSNGVSGSTPYVYSISSDPKNTAFKFKHRINTANAKIVMKIKKILLMKCTGIFLPEVLNLKAEYTTVTLGFTEMLANVHC